MQTITREGYTTIVNEYQETGNQELVQDMVNYLTIPLKQQTHKNLKRVSIFGYSFDDVYSLGLEALWKSMTDYDGSRGADFLSYFTDRFRWLVNDMMIEKKGSLADDQYFNAISLDHTNSEDGTDTSDRDQFNMADSDLFACDDSLMLKFDYSETYGYLVSQYKTKLEGANEQMQQAILNDVEIITLTMQAIEQNLTNNTDLNNFLYDALPDVDRSTVRRRKKMAFKRFGEFLLENMG